MRLFRSDRLMLAGMAILTLLYLARLGPLPTYPAFGDDNAHYLVSAKALAQGQGYRMINDPERPYATLYPIGYPAVLSAVLRLISITSIHTIEPAGPIDRVEITLLRLVAVIGYLIFIWLARRLLRNYVGPGAAVGIALAIGVTPLIFEAAGDIMSEGVFAPLIVLALILADAALIRSGPEKRAPGWAAALCGVCISAAMLMRTIGFTFVAGIALAFLLRRQWRSLPPYMAAVALIEGSWMLWSAMHRGSGYSNYAREFRSDFTWHTPIENLRTLVTFVAPGAVFPPLETQGIGSLLRHAHLLPLVALFGLSICVILCAGLIALWRRADPVAICFTFYMGVVIIWPWTPTRFMAPILPLCAILMVEGVRLLTRRLIVSPRTQSSTRRALLGLVLAGFLGACLVDLMRVRNLFVNHHWGGASAAKQWRQTSEALNWLRANTPTNALVISPYPYATYLFTGRQTAAQDWRVPLEQTLAKYQTRSPLYICAMRKEHYMSKLEYGLHPVRRYMLANPGRLHLVWAADDQVAIYSVTPGGFP